MQNLLLPLRDSQQTAPVCHCPKCQSEQYREDKLYEWDGQMVCLSCFRNGIEFWLDHAPEQVADALRLDCRPATQ